MASEEEPKAQPASIDKELNEMRKEIEYVKNDAKKERSALQHRIEDLELVAPVTDATWVQENIHSLSKRNTEKPTEEKKSEAKALFID